MGIFAQNLTNPVNQAAQIVNDPTVQQEITKAFGGPAIPAPAPVAGVFIPVPDPFGALKADDAP